MAWIDVPQAPGAARARARARDEQHPGYKIRNAAADEAELLIYDEIDSWWGVSAGDVIGALAQVTSPNLRVRVNSPGGSVFEGLAIANALRAHPANVTVQVDGLAASIASVIAMAGDRIEMAPNSMLMIHEASGMCMGDAAEMTKMAEVLDLISTNISNAYAARAGGTADEWRAAMHAETWYLPADAVDAGLADAALDAVPASPDADPEQPDENEPTEDDLAARLHARFDLAAYGYTGPKQPERPKPGPPPVKAQTSEPAEPAVSLTISLGEAVGEQLAAAVREAVTTPAVPAEPVGTGPQAGTQAAPESPPVAPEPLTNTSTPGDEAPATPDPWEAAFVALTAPRPDPWADAFAHLTTDPASSSATE